VNTAATDAPAEIEHLTLQDWDLVVAVNLRAPFLLRKVIFPHMRRARRGTIINVSSIAGKRGWANAAAYCASKFALSGFTQALNAEGKVHGIRACVIFPGAMATAWGRGTRRREKLLANGSRRRTLFRRRMWRRSSSGSHRHPPSSSSTK
jgi:NAD(P)-dependent dehydrogenase (short-subunit alcohol dehydrogenase family)